MQLAELIEKVKEMGQRELVLMRRLAKLEAKVLPKKEPAKRNSRYVPKVKGIAPTRDEIQRRIDNKFKRKAA